MKHITKYTKPFLPMIAVAIVLLFARANLDLALPDYMSRIVNVGIQQGGIDDPLPEAIRVSQMERMWIFMNDSEQEFVESQYILKTNNSSDFNELQEQYPLLENKSLYLLRDDLSKDNESHLQDLMVENMVIVFSLQQLASNQTLLMQTFMTFGVNLTVYPPSMDIFDIISTFPPQNIEMIGDAFYQNLAALGENMATQAAIQAVIAEYEAIKMDTDGIQLRYIIRTGAVMLLLTILSVACAITVGYIAGKFAAGMARDIRQDIFEHVESFSNTEFDTFSTASLITRTTNDITQIQMVAIMFIQMVFYAPIIGIGGVIRALERSTSMSWLIAIAVALLIILILIVFSLSFPKFKRIQKLVDRLNLVARENLSGIMVIRAFNQQKFEENRFDKANQNLTRNTLFINRVMVVMMPLMMLIMNALIIGIIWFGSHQVADAEIQIGDMMAFMQYSMQIVMAFLIVSVMFIIIPRAAVSWKRIMEVMDTEVQIQDPEIPKTIDTSKGVSIEFKDVCFRYPHADENVLDHLNFTANAGETTAIIGPTGSGKSTIVNLIPRFYEVCGGQILINGVDIRELSQHDLRDLIGYVPQKAVLFSGTIESNLRYADEQANSALLQQTISIAQASSFVDASAKGLQREISQGGSNVSGGQRQRLSIARALVKQPPVYIFDDSFSALDFKTDAQLRQALHIYAQNSTKIIVTQRVSTILNAEKIIVLDEGKIVGIGTHTELMETCQDYRETVYSQITEEDLQ